MQMDYKLPPSGVKRLGALGIAVLFAVFILELAFSPVPLLIIATPVAGLLVLYSMTLVKDRLEGALASLCDILIKVLAFILMFTMVYLAGKPWLVVLAAGGFIAALFIGLAVHLSKPASKAGGSDHRGTS